MREAVAPQLAEVYPQFAAQVFGVGASRFRAAEKSTAPSGRFTRLG